MNTLDYAHLAAEYAVHRQVHPGVLRALCEAARPQHSVLEVGCGTGNYITALCALTGCQGWGVDPSPEMLARAQDQLDTHPSFSRVHLGLGRGESLEVPEGQFDLVFSVDVIHHVQNHAAYLQEAYRALVSGGQLCTATDSEWIIRHREPLATYWPETIDVELGRYPRIHDLEALYLGADLTAIRRQEVEECATLLDIQPYRDKAFSALHLISESAFRRGLVRLEQDLRRGPVPLLSRYTLVWGAKR